MRSYLVKEIAIVLGLIVIAIPLIIPYFASGYFPTHDGEWAVVRLADMFRQVRDLQIPPRYSGYLNYGYGYPLFNFAYPFPYYIGVVIHALGFSFIGTIKLLFALSVPLSGIFMYFASKELWENRVAGLVSALLYMYLPYRMVDLYVRGSIGESLAFILFAAITFLIVKIIKNSSSLVMIFITAVLYAALILTHNIMAVFFSMILCGVLLGLLFHKKYAAVKAVGIVILCGILLSCFFWFPALFEKQYIALSKIPIADRNLYYVSLKQLLLPSWGFAPPTEPDGFSYQLGIAQIATLVLLVASILYVLFTKSITKFVKISVYILGFISLFLLLLFSFSSPFWNLPLLREINYPWTLLGPIGFLVSIAAGFLAIQKKPFSIGVIAIALIAIPIVLPYAKPEKYIERTDDFYLTNDATTTSSQEYMPLWVAAKPQKSADQKVLLVGSGVVSDLVVTSNKTSFTMSSQGPMKVRVNTIYYPGWKVIVDGKVQEFSYANPTGVMEFDVAGGEHGVVMSFSEAPSRMVSNVVSLVSAALIIVLMIWNFSKQKLTKTKSR